MLRVGLTGGIGAGKSAVSSRLAALGAVVVDADKAAREVVEPGTPGLARIAETFGPGVLQADGSLDRAKLAEIVFADEEARGRLNAIVHPLVHEWMRAAEAAAVRSGGDDVVVVHDVPLLAEGGQSGPASSTWSSSWTSHRRSRWSASPGAACPRSRRGRGWPRRPPGNGGSPWPTS